MSAWEEIAIAVLELLGEREISAQSAEAWLRSLVEYAEVHDA